MIPTDQYHEYARYAHAFSYDLSASDISHIDYYWVNDTTNFSIYYGAVRSEVTLGIGQVYWLEVRAYDMLGHYTSATFKVTCDDTIAPEFLETPQDYVYTEGVQGGLGVYWDCFDQSLKSYVILLDGSEVAQGTFTATMEYVYYDITLTGLSVGVYNHTIVVEDAAGHVVTDTMFVTINPFTTPTDTTTDTGIPPPIPFEVIVAIGIIGAVVVIALVCRMRR